MNNHEVPAEFVRVADQLNVAAASLRGYVSTQPKPWPDSLASRERAREDEFRALPFKFPVHHTHLTVLHYLGSSEDHLRAMSAIVRTPDVIMSLLTVLRTQLVSAAYAANLMEPGIDCKERVRRAMNCYLDSLTERMMLISRGDAAESAEFDRLDGVRRQVVTGAKSLGWKATTPAVLKSGYAKTWYVGAEPRKEMHLVDDLLGDAQIRDRVGHFLYRYLCATSHASPHSVLDFLDRDTIQAAGDGSSRGAISMTFDRLIMLALSAAVGASIAVGRGALVFGWSLDNWQAAVEPTIEEWRRHLGVQRSPLL